MGDMKKISKKEERKRKEEEEKKQREKEEKMKRKEEKLKKKEGKNNLSSGEEVDDKMKQNDASEKSSDDMDEKKRKKIIKIIRKKKIKELRKKAALIDLNTAQLSKLHTKVDVTDLTEEIKQDLKKDEVVDVSLYPKLFVVKELDSDEDIDKLCDFGTLKASRKVLQEDSSSEEDVNLENGKVGRGTKKEKVKVAGLKDMSSGSDENDTDDDDVDSDKEPKKEVGRPENDVAKASVLDSSESGEDDSDEETKPD